MVESSNNKYNRDLKGWHVLVIAIVFIVMGKVTGENIIGDLLSLTGYFFVLLAIVVSVSNNIKRSR